MRPISPDDVAVRATDLPQQTVIPYDQMVLLDGPTSGGGAALPQDLVSGSINRITSRVGVPPLGSEILIQPPSGSAHLYDLATVTGQSISFYLGPRSTAPTTDLLGLPVQPGHSYFDLNTNQMMVLGTDMVWRLQGQPVPAATRRYVWTITGTTTTLPGTDDYGNPLSYDEAHPETLSLFINGARQVGGLDYVVASFITLLVAVVADDIVEIVVHVPPVPDYVAAPVAIDTTTWVPNGSTTSFALKDQLGRVVVPASSRAADLWLLSVPGGAAGTIAATWRALAPGIEYVIAGSTVTLTVAPPAGALLQMTVWQLDPQVRTALLATVDFTLDASHVGALITGTVTGIDVVVPSAATLGAGFYCDFLADGFTVTLHWPGGATTVLTNHQLVRLFTANGKLRTTPAQATVVQV